MVGLEDIPEGWWTKEQAIDPATGLRVGAAVNMNRLIASPEVNEHYPVLAEAAHTVASYQLRTRATVAGNLCNASPAGDTIGAGLVLDAKVHVHGVDGDRVEALRTFFKGPGKTVLKPGDIATSIHFPIPPSGAVARYIKLGRNRLGDLAIVGWDDVMAGHPEFVKVGAQTANWMPSTPFTSTKCAPSFS